MRLIHSPVLILQLFKVIAKILRFHPIMFYRIKLIIGIFIDEGYEGKFYYLVIQ